MVGRPVGTGRCVHTRSSDTEHRLAGLRRLPQPDPPAQGDEPDFEVSCERLDGRRRDPGHSRIMNTDVIRTHTSAPKPPPTNPRLASALVGSPSKIHRPLMADSAPARQPTAPSQTGMTRVNNITTDAATMKSA